MNIEPCRSKFTVEAERYGFPFDVFCKYPKGHDGHCIGKATIDGMEIEVKFGTEKELHD